LTGGKQITNKICKFPVVQYLRKCQRHTSGRCWAKIFGHQTNYASHAKIAKR